MRRVEFRLFGFPSARLEWRTVQLSLRKALALLAYLADSGSPVGRDYMATLLWPEADLEAARSMLRRTLHKIHVTFDADLIGADRTSLSLSSSLTSHVDTHAFEAACTRGRFDEAVQFYGGDFLEGLSIGGCPAFEEWAFFRREALRSRLVQTLERLIEAKIEARDHTAAIAYAARLVSLDPLSERAHRQLIGAHLAAGDRKAAERQLAACTRLLRMELGVSPSGTTSALLHGPWSPQSAEVPRTRYVYADGVYLAFQTVGSGPADIVLVPGFVTHVERIWDDPRIRAWLTTVSSIGRLILFDRRGVGLSDRIGARPTVEATARDILAVMDAARSRRAILVGASEGVPACIRFTTDYSDRLVGLILWGALAKGSYSSDHPFALTREQYDLWARRLVSKWGSPAEIEVFAPSLVGDRQAEAWWAGLLRAASSPGAIKGVLEAFRDADVRHLLPRISVPTRVLHRSGDRAVRREAGHFVAANIPTAQFVEVRGNDHWFWVGDLEPLIRCVREMAVVNHP
jgi:DNA-binding SARP family transcriptional activator/pimeloyl-ACP methyl ester carboxylesterase